MRQFLFVVERFGEVCFVYLLMVWGPYCTRLFGMDKKYMAVVDIRAIQRKVLFYFVNFSHLFHKLLLGFFLNSFVLFTSLFREFCFCTRLYWVKFLYIY